MNLEIKKSTGFVSTSEAIVLVLSQITDLSVIQELEEKDLAYLNKKLEKKDKLVHIRFNNKNLFVFQPDIEKKSYDIQESLRKAGARITSALNEEKIESVSLIQLEGNSQWIISVLDGLVLGNYQFIKYFSKPEEKQNSLKSISVSHTEVDQDLLIQKLILYKSIYLTKDLVNEPPAQLNSLDLAQAALQAGKTFGFTTEILAKAQIEALKMGGLLAVNKGSEIEPSFSILEWKPANAKNTQPYILVGKGVVYDSGGYSLKPTKDSMDYMKCDMSGAATVIGTLSAVAGNKLPLWIIGLIPATDNKVSSAAYVPGDVITISDGTTVEVLNTDAEGRLILSDALVFAQKYNPELVIDLATLTGAAAVAIGPLAAVAFSTAPEAVFSNLKSEGFNTYERIVEFPLWDDYEPMIKSDIADIKNVGGGYGGAITAAKFLQHFTKYPWIHLDIAGPAFLSSNDSYRGKGASGYGVRLLFEFLKKNAI